jgi:3D (Asp-Asp-Asp) domain-containing protein
MRKRKMRKTIILSCVALLSWFFLLFQIIELIKKVERLKSKPPETIIVERDISPIPYKELGEYTISFYCDCPICTKTAKGSKTTTGTKPKEGRTIACDGEILKMGDIVYIESVGVRVCEDKGSAIYGKRIDVYMDGHDIANKMGIRKVNVYRIGG